MGDNRRRSIEMDKREISSFIESERTGVLATLGPDGLPHLVAMWYVVINDEIWMETKSKSQKAKNLERDNRFSFLVEAGESYNELRGASFEGIVELSVDSDDLWQVGVHLYARYTGPYHEGARKDVEALINNRIAMRLQPTRTRTWDHRKL